MTTHVVADDVFGQVALRGWEVQRRVLEGTLDPGNVSRDLQTIAEGGRSSSPFFADEKVPSKANYPDDYRWKPISDQVNILQRYFPMLDTVHTSTLQKLPVLPDEAEGWFVVPRYQQVAKTYNEAVVKAFRALRSARNFSSYPENSFNRECLRLADRTETAFKIFGKKQPGSYLVFPAQFGILHRGRSSRRTDEVITGTRQFGLDAFSIACMLLTHPDREISLSHLQILVSGNVYFNFGSTAISQQSLIFFVVDGQLRQSCQWVGSADSNFGSPTGFLW